MNQEQGLVKKKLGAKEFLIIAIGLEILRGLFPESAINYWSSTFGFFVGMIGLIYLIYEAIKKVGTPKARWINFALFIGWILSMVITMNAGE